MKRKEKRNNDLLYNIIIITIMILLCYFHFYNNGVILFNNNQMIKEEQLKREEYEACLIEQYNNNDDTDLVNDYKNELIEIINKYKVSLYYLDPVKGFMFKYNEDKSYYAASTIKMLDAIYIYNKALENDIDLDEEIKYKNNNYMSTSKKMDKYDFGDKVSLRDLVRYAVTYSDNTAHNMLINYIGFNELKNYGKSLGATKTLYGTDLFGEITVDDSIVYLKELYRFINDNNQYSDEIKQIFIDSEQNYLDIPELNIEAAIKYGEYSYYYHENGIVYDQNPYLISILSTIGNNEKAFREINEKVYQLHKAFYQERQNRCYSKIYE